MEFKTKDDVRKRATHLFKTEKYWATETDTLSFRLRGIYPVGPRGDGEPEFGWRYIDCQISPIRYEAAHRIDELEAKVQELRTKLNEFEEFEGLDKTV